MLPPKKNPTPGRGHCLEFLRKLVEARCVVRCDKSLGSFKTRRFQIKFRSGFNRHHCQRIRAEALEQLRGTTEKVDFLAEQEGSQNNCRGERAPSHSPRLNRACCSFQPFKNTLPQPFGRRDRREFLDENIVKLALLSQPRAELRILPGEF